MTARGIVWKSICRSCWYGSIMYYLYLIIWYVWFIESHMYSDAYHIYKTYISKNIYVYIKRIQKKTLRGIYLSTTHCRFRWIPIGIPEWGGICRVVLHDTLALRKICCLDESFRETNLPKIYFISLLCFRCISSVMHEHIYYSCDMSNVESVGHVEFHCLVKKHMAFQCP